MPHQPLPAIDPTTLTAVTGGGHKRACAAARGDIDWAKHQRERDDISYDDFMTQVAAIVGKAPRHCQRKLAIRGQDPGIAGLKP
jgi:hypothetical protein